MKIFKELKKLGYIHYSATTIEELDDLPLNSAERISEQALVLRWFREKYNLYHVITIADLGKYESGNPDFQCAIYSKDPVVITKMDNYKTYEEAELACLEKLIEIVKNKYIK